MYIYFDKNGTLKELVNDTAIRQYNEGENVLYLYFESENTPIGLSIGITQNDEAQTTITEILDVDSFEEKEIPFNKDRTLKYFQYGKAYKFYVYALTASDLAYSGFLKITPYVQFVSASAVYGDICLNVSASAIVPTTQETYAEYLYLLSQINKIKSEMSEYNAIEIVGDVEDYTLTDDDKVKLSQDICIIKHTTDLSNQRRLIGYYYKANLNRLSGTGEYIFVCPNNIDIDVEENEISATILKISSSSYEITKETTIFSNHLYQHNLTLSTSSPSSTFNAQILTTSNETMTTATVRDYILANQDINFPLYENTGYTNSNGNGGILSWWRLKVNDNVLQVSGERYLIANGSISTINADISGVIDIVKKIM